MLQIAGNVTVERLQAAVGRLGLTLLASENLAITGSTVARFRITDGRSPAEIIPALAAIQLVAVAQPNYVYTLQQQPSETAPASRGDATQGDPAQYILEKLKISDVHRMVRGTNVPIAVIDLEIDVDASRPGGRRSRSASTRSARRRSRMPTAPAWRAPSPRTSGSSVPRRPRGCSPCTPSPPPRRPPRAPRSTSSRASTGRCSEGARIINMSFAGPKDPSLARALKAAYDKGIVLIAAAGNAGPKSPPLFPGADPNVIAVTATDVDDKLFTGANRGKYISVSAPGVPGGGGGGGGGGGIACRPSVAVTALGSAPERAGEISARHCRRRRSRRCPCHRPP